MPLDAAPPAWLATGVPVAVTVAPQASGEAVLVRESPGPETVLVRLPVTAGAPAVVTAPRALRDGRYRLRVELPGEAPRRFALRMRPLRLVAVGDVSPGSALAAVRRHGAAWHWSAVGPWLRSRDLVVANLETAVGGGGRPWPGKNFHFTSPPATIRAMARSGGVDVVSVANNHGADYGRAHLVRGLRTIRRAGLAVVGGGRDLDAALAPAIREVGGLRVAFLGFDGFPPYGFWATRSRAGLAPATEADVRRAVRAARADADVVVAYFHWGIELRTRPGPKQRRLARAAFAAGADVVLGAHPHVLQPVERRSGGRLVAWSLGNFVFAPGSVAGTYSGALAIDLGADGVVAHRLRAVRIVDSRPVFRR